VNLFKNLPIGDLAVHDARPLFDYPYPPATATAQSFDVFFRALNGVWFEDARLQKVNGQWKQAIRVMRVEGSKDVILYEHHDDAYPLTNGEVDWGSQ
jgi:hypothetical protein